MHPSANNLIWIDLEMTGLNPATDHIIEIATIVTDPELNILQEGPVLAIYTNDTILNQMDAWNTQQHNSSGLISRIRASQYSVADAERMTLEFIHQLVPRGQSPMCGNSVCQDRRFLARLMPQLEAYFHYRHIDVSTVKELIHRWAPECDKFNKDATHRALDDIRDSIDELCYYRQRFFTI